MNWSLESAAGSASSSALEVARAADEPEELQPSQALVDAAMAQGHELAKALGPRLADVLLTVQGHEGEADDTGFATGYVQITVSRLRQSLAVSLTLVFWLAFTGTILMTAAHRTRSEAKTAIVLAMAAMAAVGLIA